jgi:glycosyltransferase involved in cell wall biosynthesis
MTKINQAEPFVSVCMVTYNQSRWISQAIEGVLSQRTSFPYELVISDDCSTDNTPNLIKDFTISRPEIIKPFFNESNLGLSKNFSNGLNKCQGRYIAICEGDDYWTDPDKLQKQVEVMEANPDFILTSHNSGRLHESDLIIENNKFSQGFTYDQERHLREWVTQPVTCMFRNIFRDYTLLNRENIFCDVILFYELLKHGNGYFLKDNMAIFRVHQSALSSGLSRWQWLRNHVIMFDYLFKYNKRDKLLSRLSARYCLSIFIFNLSAGRNDNIDFNPLKEYFVRTNSITDKLITVFIRLPYYFIRHGIFPKLRALFNYGK